jgi:hypothetical protein
METEYTIENIIEIKKILDKSNPIDPQWIPSNDLKWEEGGLDD